MSTRTASEWVARYRAGGRARVVRPLVRTSTVCQAARRMRSSSVIAALRRLRMTAAEIAEVLEMALSTVSAVLLRIGLGKRSRPQDHRNRQTGTILRIGVYQGLNSVKNKKEHRVLPPDAPASYPPPGTLPTLTAERGRSAWCRPWYQPYPESSRLQCSGRREAHHLQPSRSDVHRSG